VPLLAFPPLATRAHLVQHPKTLLAHQPALICGQPAMAPQLARKVRGTQLKHAASSLADHASTRRAAARDHSSIGGSPITSAPEG